MAKVLVENTKAHSIDLQIKTKQGVEKVTIPAARENQFDRKTIDNGVAEVDGSFLEAAKKKPVVQAYFETGMLREKREEILVQPEPPVAPAQPEAGAPQPWANPNQTPAAAR